MTLKPSVLWLTQKPGDSNYFTCHESFQSLHRGRRRVRDKLEQAAALLGPEHRKSILERLHRFRSERFVVDGELVLQGVDDDDDGL